MNIFYLDKNPQLAAQAHFDKHVVKMILESAQLLSTAHRVLDGDFWLDKDRAGRRLKRWVMWDSEMENMLYKATHYNHPSAIWCRENDENYEWLYWLFRDLLDEYTYRYGKVHASSRLVPYLARIPENIPDGRFFEVTPAMGNEFIIPGDSVASYRNYYIKTKMPFYAYTKRDAPEWIVEELTKVK